MLVALCEPDWEEPLATELREEFSASAIKFPSPGIVTLPEWQEFSAESRPSLVWSRQTLPSAEQLSAPSINQWVEAIGQRIIRVMKGDEGLWTLLLGAAVPETNAVSPRRIGLIEEGLREWLKRKQKRLLKTWMPCGEATKSCLLQVAWTAADSAYWSYCSPETSRHATPALSRFSAGLPPVASDLEAPARAFAKLVEAQQRLGRSIKPDETCVDLGASPGGWTWVALQHGARVTAIDRSPLRADLMRHDDVEFVKGDAFAFEPPQPVDWLLCDVAAFPQRTLELLQLWLGQRWCRNFVVTTKFRSNEGYELLPAYKQLLRDSGYKFQLRRLNANKNEMTSMGALG